MMISKWRRGITRFGGPSCLRRDGETRAGTTNWSWRLDATTCMLNLGGETRRTELTLLDRGVLLSRFATANPLPLPPPMPFFVSNNQHPSPEPLPRSPTARPSIPIRCRPPLFTVLICVRCPACFHYPFATSTQRTRETAVKEDEPSVPTQRGEFIWLISPGGIRLG